MCGKYRTAGKCHNSASGKRLQAYIFAAMQSRNQAFFRSEWFRALTRLDGEMLITRLENERNGFYG